MLAESFLQSSGPLKSPPRAPLAFRVGVVGHRPNRLQHAKLDQLAAVLRAVLKTVKEEVLTAKQDCAVLYDDSTPVLRSLSPLAEGTDRLFADQALDLGFELCYVMPFRQAEFEKDFAPGKALEPDSLDRFRSLAKRATVRFELDGSVTMRDRLTAQVAAPC